MLHVIGPMLNKPWTNGPVTLYHGTLESDAQNIINNRILLNRSQKRSDFSRGFYTTTSRTQAVKFANKRFDDEREANPRTTNAAAVLSWNVSRNSLGGLDSLVFVRGRDNEDYWQFVSHCRMSARSHKPNGEYYAVVYGPVNRDYIARLVMADSDQISFHTDDSVSLLAGGPAKHETGKPRLAA